MKKYLNLLLTALIVAFAVWQWGNLAYMNLRPADPILPGWEEYDETGFARSVASGEPVMVEIYASWCPVCLAQHRAFEALAGAGQAPEIRAIRVDFDRDSAFIQHQNIHATGMLILYRQGHEIARGTGLTTPDLILDFLARNDIVS